MVNKVKACILSSGTGSNLESIIKTTRNYNYPVFPEDYAYYLLNDNHTLIMISAVKSINNNFKYDITTKMLEVLPENNRYNFVISSILKGCGFKNMESLHECKYYNPLISANLIN